MWRNKSHIICLKEDCEVRCLIHFELIRASSTMLKTLGDSIFARIKRFALAFKKQELQKMILIKLEKRMHLL